MTEIRPAAPEDALAVARVHVRAWQVAYRGLIAQAYLDSLKPEVWAAKYAFHRTGPESPTTLVAVTGETVCGLAMFGPYRGVELPHSAELLAIYVDPDHWDTGVGRKLIVATREQLRRHGFTEAALWVLDGNARARRFYGRDGWSRDRGRQTKTIAGAQMDEVRYRRGLGDRSA
ncbi:acetyltransferase [Mycobacterium sp. 852002-51163_SCH5372311]|uniref:GNAT family N-acetyltransferase n=1 Tax=Mycobacterium sp. 852002-51163_SCH5372311 TaxID=1834097 RepID=UPI0007FD8E09|nr:GNAT family N-acetyltransferase [Mycobacterium sp. 852002-51163_SCH5372311]OBF84386.1 acetyltransferase [Mycobacterium sp. 852002-51163_SCH5372311]